MYLPPPPLNWGKKYDEWENIGGKRRKKWGKGGKKREKIKKKEELRQNFIFWGKYIPTPLKATNRLINNVDILFNHNVCMTSFVNIFILNSYFRQCMKTSTKSPGISFGIRGTK